MVKGSFTGEHVSPIPPTRLWNASIRDGHNLAPKIMPEVISSCTMVEGDGGVGSIKQVNFTPAMKDFTYIKDRIDVVDDEKHVYKYTDIEGGFIGSKLKTCSFEISFEPANNGGSLSKLKVEYDSIGDGPLAEEDVAKIKEWILGMVKAVEGYLQANPGAYA